MKKNVMTLFLFSFCFLMFGVADMPGPDDDMSDFPREVWPYIRTIAILDMVQIESIIMKDLNPLHERGIEALGKNIAIASANQFNMILEVRAKEFKEVLSEIDNRLKLQYRTAAMQFNTFGSLSADRADSLLVLYKLQLEVYRKSFITSFKLTDSEMKALEATIGNHQNMYSCLVEKNIIK